MLFNTIFTFLTVISIDFLILQLSRPIDDKLHVLQ